MGLVSTIYVGEVRKLSSWHVCDISVRTAHLA
jgi:hypothetical protein